MAFHGIHEGLFENVEYHQEAHYEDYNLGCVGGPGPYQVTYQQGAYDN